MKTANKPIATIILSVVLALTSVFCMFGAFSMSTSADGGTVEDKVNYSTQCVYHWKRIQTLDDLLNLSTSRYETFNIIIMWGDGKKNAYYTVGDNEYAANAINHPYINYLADEFYSPDDLNSWSMFFYAFNYYGRHTYCVGINNSKGYYLYEGNHYKSGCADDVNWYPDHWKIFSIAAHVENNSEHYGWYNKYCPKGYVQICHQRDGEDSCWEQHGSHIEFDADSSWNLDKFVLYVNDYNLYDNALYDHTVKSGSTLQIEGDAFIKEGCKLTIEPGATLSVKGNLINNGAILNYGTVIVNTGGAITYFGAKSDIASTIINYGSYYTLGNSKIAPLRGEGNFIVMPGARVVQANKVAAVPASGGGAAVPGIGATFQLRGGANCVCFGTMFLPSTLQMSSSQFRIESGAYVNLNGYITKKLGNLNKLSKENLSEYGNTNTTYPNKFYNEKSVIEQYGEMVYTSFEGNSKLEIIK